MAGEAIDMVGEPIEVPAGDVRDVSAVTAPDERDVVDVKLVSGTVSVPAPGAALPMTSGRVLSDLMCPLLVRDTSAIDTSTVIEQHYAADGSPAGSTIHRYPQQVVETPVPCPDCGKIVERHMLVANAATGTRDCAIAVNMKLRGEDVTKILGGAPGIVTALADQKHPEPLLPETAPQDDALVAQRESGLVPDLAPAKTAAAAENIGGQDPRPTREPGVRT